MSPGTIRLGGIFVFVNIAVIVLGAVIGAIIAGDAAGSGLRGEAAAGVGVVNIVVGIVQMLLTIFILLATKGLFNAHQYRGGDIPILLLVVVGAAIFLLAIIAGIDPQRLIGRGGSAAGIIGIVLLVLILGYFVLAIVFSINCMSFGGRAGGGLWKAIGILYLMTMLVMAVAVTIILVAAINAGPAAENAVGTAVGGVIGVFAIIAGLLVGLAGLICHGIGLIMGAGKLEAR
jgi:hypothetical protein